LASLKRIILCWKLKAKQQFLRGCCIMGPVALAFQTKDIVGCIGKFLTDKAFFNFRKVNKACYNASEACFLHILKKCFNDEYGAIAPCENSISTKGIWNLKTRIKAVLDFDKVPQGEILHIDSEGIPSWKASEGKTFFERLKQKYSFFRGDYIG